MWWRPELDDLAEAVLLAGQHASPGRYRNVETGACLQLDEEGPLPPSFDGRVACYVLVRGAWDQAVVADAGREHRSKRLD